jgi:hypothetical protein
LLEAPLGEALTSLWATPLFVVGYGLSLAALAAIWRMSRRRLERWQPGEFEVVY